MKSPVNWTSIILKIQSIAGNLEDKDVDLRRILKRFNLLRYTARINKLNFTLISTKQYANILEFSLFQEMLYLYIEMEITLTQGSYF